MNQKTDVNRMLWIAWWSLWIVWWTFFFTVAIWTFPNCSKPQPQEPPEQAPPDTVIVHFHHDHEVVIIDSMFFICDSVDLLIQFTVIGDQSQPNIYDYYVNGIFRGRFTISKTYLKPTDLIFEVLFQNMVFGDIITIRVISGSLAGVVGSSIVGIECSGG